METKEKNNRKLLLVLPLLVLPFLALAFYALDGGRGYASAKQSNLQQGINTDLPDAQFKKDDPQDKLSIYELVKRDSTNNFGNSFTGQDSTGQPGLEFPSSANSKDPNEQRINEKLAQISKEINRPAQPYNPPSAATRPQSQVAINSDVDRLEKLMRSMQEGKAEDPEMQQLSELLDKIVAIQNPGIVQEKLKQQQTLVKDSAFRAIPAVIEGNQKVAQGGIVKLRLLDTIHLKGLAIPKNQMLFGSCNITNQRLLLTIKNIRLGTSIIPVDLSVFSLDGMIGINAPEAELGEAAGSGADNALQSMQILTMDQSLATQAAGAGITAVKDLISKKVKHIKVRLKAGQAVLLRNNQFDKH